MADFYPTTITPETTKRGPGRLMYASISTTFPAQISDLINMSLFTATASWFDLGATKGGIQIGFNNSETVLDVDQIASAIMTVPDDAEMFVQANLAEASLDRLSFSWEGDAVTINAAPPNPEKNTGFGPFDSYTQRRLAAGYRSPQSGKLAFFVFRKAQRAPQESTITLNKGGDQVTIPTRFRVLPDTSIAVVRQRFGLAFEQQ
jgi:hypothetical protein